VALVDAGLFLQDDWKVRPNITLSYGLRFETQNNFSDKSDFAPRVGLAWGHWGKRQAIRRRWWLRAGFGMFYDRFTYDLVETQQRFNLLQPLQQQLQIQNPHFSCQCRIRCRPGLWFRRSTKTTPICARRIRSRRV